MIGWGDTDAARIVYTARVPHFGMEAIEAWFLQRLGVGWYEMNTELGFGTPFVHLEVAFRSPMRPGETIATRVLLDHAGRSSLRFALDSRDGTRLCWTGRFACAFVGEGFRSIRIPDRFTGAVAQERAIAEAAQAEPHTAP